MPTSILLCLGRVDGLGLEWPPKPAREVLVSADLESEGIILKREL
jgi:hypothetical protein